MSKEFKLPNRNTWVKTVLRRASLRWPGRNECFKRARVARGLYKCAMCLSEKFKSNQVHLDHIDPVIDISVGFNGWDDYINRLLPDVEGFQVLCVNCHEIKTALEDSMRTKLGQMRKEKGIKKKS